MAILTFEPTPLDLRFLVSVVGIILLLAFIAWESLELSDE
jgi:hypothetical protein